MLQHMYGESLAIIKIDISNGTHYSNFRIGPALTVQRVRPHTLNIRCSLDQICFELSIVRLYSLLWLTKIRGLRRYIHGTLN